MKNTLNKLFRQRALRSNGSPEASNSKGDPFLIAFGIYGAVGFQLAFSVVGGVLGGQWLDKKYGLSPWLTLAGLVVGAVAGFYNLIKILNWKTNRSS